MTATENPSSDGKETTHVLRGRLRVARIPVSPEPVAVPWPPALPAPFAHFFIDRVVIFVWPLGGSPTFELFVPVGADVTGGDTDDTLPFLDFLFGRGQCLD
jgi:hypothetical protein